MSSDLTGAFGRPARDLSQRLTKNPRRGRPEQPADDETQDDPNVSADHGSGGPETTPSEPETSRATHLASAPKPRDDPDPPTPPDDETGGTAGNPTRTSATTQSPGPDRGAPARSRRASSSTKGRSTGRSSTGDNPNPDASYQVPVYVHPGVRSAATNRRKTDKLTNAEIAFDAIDEVQHRLTALIRDRRLQARPESSLFPGRVRRGRLAGGGAATTVGEARRVLWGFRATDAELEVIDRLVTDSGAESRSELIAVALEESLLR